MIFEIGDRVKVKLPNSEKLAELKIWTGEVIKFFSDIEWYCHFPEMYGVRLESGAVVTFFEDELEIVK